MSDSTGNSAPTSSPVITTSTTTAIKTAPDTAPDQESAEELAYANRPFRGWRLLAVVGLVVVVLAIISAIVDWVVIGPLEGRVF